MFTNIRKEDISMTLGEKLKLLRGEKEITQEELAEQLSVSRSAIGKWESTD